MSMGSSKVEVIVMECNRGLISKGFEFQWERTNLVIKSETAVLFGRFSESTAAVA